MYDRLLVPTDGSAHATRAARHARLVATATDAVVDVINVVDPTRVAGAFSAGGVSEASLRDVAAERVDDVTDTAAVVGDASTGNTDVVHGRPAERILTYVDEHDVDLVVMGTRGTSGLTHALLGSVADRVLRQAPVPVLAAESSGTGPTPGSLYDDVLVPTDGSDTARAAIAHALAVATAADAKVHGLAVVEDAIPTELVDRPLTVGLTDSAAETATETVAVRAKDRDLPAERTVREGRPGRRIRAYAEQHDIGLVVMGTHGDSGIERVVLGSTTEWLVRHAEVPVLAVPSATA